MQVPPLIKGLKYPSYSLQTHTPLQNQQNTSGYMRLGPLYQLNMSNVNKISPGARSVVDCGTKGRNLDRFA